MSSQPFFTHHAHDGSITARPDARVPPTRLILAATRRHASAAPSDDEIIRSFDHSSHSMIRSRWSAPVPCRCPARCELASAADLSPVAAGVARGRWGSARAGSYPPDRAQSPLARGCRTCRPNVTHVDQTLHDAVVRREWPTGTIAVYSKESADSGRVCVREREPRGCILGHEAAA